jgi:hypothetical protein
MYTSRTQELPRADTGGHLTPPRHLTRHPQTASRTRHAQYPVSPSRPSRPAPPPMRTEHAIQAFEDTQPVFSDFDLVTDCNTLMNRHIAPPAWATVDDDYHEIRRVRPARGPAAPSSDAVRRRQRTQVSVSRSTSSITGNGTPGSSRSSNSPAYYSRHQYQTPHLVISEIEDSSEDEATEPASMVASNSPSAMGVHQPRSYHHEGQSRPLSDRQAPAKAGASGPSRRPLKGFKRMVQKLLDKFRSKGTSGRLPPPTRNLPPVPVPVTTTGIVTMSSVPWNTYDGVQYYVHGGLNTSALSLQRTHTPLHPLTGATDQAAARVQMAMQTGSSELELLMRSTDRMRQVHDWQDGIIVDLMRM